MKTIKVDFSLQVNINKVSDKFFKKHQDVYIKFLDNIKNYYLRNEQNIDIVAMKNYKGIFRMRIRDYRVIYSVKNGKIKIINVLLADSRGKIYKDFDK